MPHRRKKSRKEGQPPKNKGANRRKTKADPIAAGYAERQEQWPTARSKTPRKKAAGGKRQASGPVRKRGKKVAAAKKPTRRSAKAP